MLCPSLHWIAKHRQNCWTLTSSTFYVSFNILNEYIKASDGHVGQGKSMTFSGEALWSCSHMAHSYRPLVPLYLIRQLDPQTWTGAWQPHLCHSYLPPCFAPKVVISSLLTWTSPWIPTALSESRRWRPSGRQLLRLISTQAYIKYYNW